MGEAREGRQAAGRRLPRSSVARAAEPLCALFRVWLLGGRHGFKLLLRSRREDRPFLSPSFCFFAGRRLQGLVQPGTPSLVQLPSCVALGGFKSHGKAKSWNAKEDQTIRVELVHCGSPASGGRVPRLDSV